MLTNRSLEREAADWRVRRPAGSVLSHRSSGTGRAPETRASPSSSRSPSKLSHFVFIYASSGRRRPHGQFIRWAPEAWRASGRSIYYLLRPRSILSILETRRPAHCLFVVRRQAGELFVNRTPPLRCSTGARARFHWPSSVRRTIDRFGRRSPSIEPAAGSSYGRRQTNMRARMCSPQTSRP
jgi:hypothetical protein